MVVYIDKDKKCHAEAAEGLRAFDVPFFDGKCPAFIEGYIHVPFEEVLITEDGEVYEGKTTVPWKDYNILAAYQQQYEAMLAEKQDMQTALELLEVRADG